MKKLRTFNILTLKSMRTVISQAIRSCCIKGEFRGGYVVLLSPLLFQDFTDYLESRKTIHGDDAMLADWKERLYISGVHLRSCPGLEGGVLLRMDISNPTVLARLRD